MKRFKRFIAVLLLVMLALPGRMNVSAQEVDITEECNELHEHEIAEAGLSIQAMAACTYHLVAGQSWSVKSGCTTTYYYGDRCATCGYTVNKYITATATNHDFPTPIFVVNGPVFKSVKCRNCDTFTIVYNPEFQ